jgi:dienelactone hydrolase
MERIYDVMRTIDWLKQRQDADSGFIASMGNSEGGSLSLYCAAVDERIKAVMASCCFSSYVDSIGRRAACPDAYIPGILQWIEMYDVAGLIAPRTLLLVAGENDHIFPARLGKSAFVKTRRIYAACEAKERIDFLAGPEGHRPYPNIAWPVFQEMIQ